MGANGNGAAMRDCSVARSGPACSETRPDRDRARASGRGARGPGGAGSSGSDTPPLGIHGKSTATTPRKRPPKSLFQAQLEAYTLQETAAQILRDNRALNACRRAPIGGDENARGVTVKRTEDGTGASYAGLQTCKLHHVCPCCACRRSELDRAELSAEIARVGELGGTVLLATYTVRHKRADKIADVLGHSSRRGARGRGLLGAQEAMTGNRPYRALRGAHGVQHAIKALEVTYGPNGPHPHAHTLLLADRSDVDAEKLRSELYPIWHDTAARFGLDMTERRGLTVVQTWGEVQDYVAKHGYPKEGPTWGIESELARGHVKRRRHVEGRPVGYTPWELLKITTHEGCGWQSAKFHEHAAAMKGRSRLHRSAGLRAWLDLDAAATGTDQGEAWELLDPFEWFAVRWAGKRADLLELARQGDRDVFRGFVADLYAAYLDDLDRVAA